MKLRPKSTEKQDKNVSEQMARMHALLSEKNDIIEMKDDVIEKKSDVIAEQQRRIAQLEEYLRLAQHKRFGASSEQTPPEQGNLFNEAETEVTTELEVEEPEVEVTDTKAKKGRKPFSAKLPRHQVFAYLTDEEKAGAIDTFFAKVREELDIIPAKVRVLEYMQEKAVFKDENGRQTITLAQVPKHPLPKAMGSVNLITFIIISKFADGLPLYRLEGIIKRYGGDISRATFANWVIALAKQLQPLINLLREYQNEGLLLMMDETRVQVLKELGYSPTGNKYMWVTLGGPPGQQSVLFDYDPSRGREIPMRLLDGFTQGYLQTDGYAGYHEVCRINQLTLQGCMDHARRKFVEAQAAQPKGSKIKATKADMALSFINKLYVIERNIKLLSDKEKYRVRQEKSIPVLKKLRVWLTDNRPRVAKNSLTGIAMTYLHNQWDKLVVYCEHGQLRISNIMAENAVRPFVIGRKAWLFCDTPAGAHASAVHYSLIQSAKLHDIEPFDYLSRILKALPYADTVEKIEMLLPWNFKNGEFEKLIPYVH